VTQIKQSPDSPFAKIISSPLAGVNSHAQLLILNMPKPAEIHSSADPTSVISTTKSESKKNKMKAKSNAPR
jgi:rod shape-determining protein MreC